MNWTVSWEIDIEAGSAMDAAVTARSIQLDPQSTATVFRVAREPGHTTAPARWYEVDVATGESTIPREADPRRAQPDAVVFLEDTARLTTVEPWLRDALRRIAFDYQAMRERQDALEATRSERATLASRRDRQADEIEQLQAKLAVVQNSHDWLYREKQRLEAAIRLAVKENGPNADGANESLLALERALPT